MKKEPVLIILGGLAVLVGLGLEMCNQLAWTALTQAQVGSVTAFVGGVCALVGAAIRGTVFSPATHAAEIHDALMAPPPFEVANGLVKVLAVDPAPLPLITTSFPPPATPPATPAV